MPIKMLSGMGILFISIPFFFTVNISPSLPTGLYVRQFGQSLKQGTIVRIDGEPYGRRFDLLKIAAAMPGQAVHVSADKYIAAGRTWAFQSDGSIPVQAFDGPVPAGHIFVAGSHPQSYDSRYFGPVPFGRIKAHYRALWVTGEGGTILR